MEVQLAQWDVLQLLEPGYILVSWRFCHYHTRNALVRKSWIDVQKREGFLMVRLTKAGMEIRDMIYAVHARRKDSATSSHFVAGHKVEVLNQ